MKSLILLLALLTALPCAARAHAFLDEASPRVGSEDNPAPDRLRLKFTQGVEADFCHVTVTLADVPIAMADPTADPADKSTLIVKPKAKLQPGLYKVAWAVVSVDTHHTSGTYSFVVAP